jgi:phosphohistidine phosphatase
MGKMPERVLFLIRHAIAAEQGEAYPDDGKRPLTEDGAGQFRKAAKGLAKLGVEVDCILTSPLVRARQTADILAAAMPGRVEVVETDALRPGAPFDGLVRDLSDHSDCSALALVGHEPGIGEMAARLVNAATAFEFKKGAVCRIDVQGWPPKAGAGCLRWFAPPKMLKKLKG